MSDEDRAQEELSWVDFCPVCTSKLIPKMRASYSGMRFDFPSNKWVEADIPTKLLGKICPDGHGEFVVGDDIVFKLNKHSE